MDPVTQGLLGAVAAQSYGAKKLGRHAALIGAIGGMAADLDVLIQDASDPLVALFYHRHFTHSLAFIPIGGFLAFLPFLFFRVFRDRWREGVIAAIIGYATHGLLDACTTYGTLLFWPFSMRRIAWDNVAIIDAFFTVPLGVGVLCAHLKRSNRLAVMTMIFCLGYLAFGFLQNFRAKNEIQRMALRRGHQIERIRVIPTFSNLVYWNSIYEAGENLYLDAVKIPLIGSNKFEEGSVHKKLYPENLLLQYPHPQQHRAINIFSWFADDWIFPIAESPLIIGDGRYVFDEGKKQSLWGLKLFANAQPAPYVMVRSERMSRGRLVQYIRKIWN